MKSHQQKKVNNFKKDNNCKKDLCIDFNSCNHIFIKDLIDITPDYSKEITYCEICEFTPK